MRGETNSKHSFEVYDLIAAVLRQAVVDFLELEAMGLIQGGRVIRSKWPRPRHSCGQTFVLVGDKVSIAEAESAVSFLFRGGAKKFFEAADLNIKTEEVIEQLIGQNRKEKKAE